MWEVGTGFLLGPKSLAPLKEILQEGNPTWQIQKT